MIRNDHLEKSRRFNFININSVQVGTHICILALTHDPLGFHGFNLI